MRPPRFVWSPSRRSPPPLFTKSHRVKSSFLSRALLRFIMTRTSASERETGDILSIVLVFNSFLNVEVGNMNETEIEFVRYLQKQINILQEKIKVLEIKIKENEKKTN